MNWVDYAMVALVVAAVVALVPWPGDHMNRHMAASGAPVPTDPTQEA